ncbi:hypothetical protein SAICODRAFT_25744 [Saitoella complicata NRRL Y-17804]|uniref:uncharacterized protein n=1 Tax=Saitoella complicata (strain BCRC 22490 / CBS 7301 / JCM 7358 / NBRC 10748 / NRRL Y-17804) TaxID=698492 RepID=UPI0008678C3A|nr:uncharacterized protein SAICODRAFT_25744 [Saitoella complicata NRRL Y-17804]ODQ52832.1 hypothetical protein SAICODRAFT_25744 [Saitoella complicata NRRL Y-17804]
MLSLRILKVVRPICRVTAHYLACRPALSWHRFTSNANSTSDSVLVSDTATLKPLSDTSTTAQKGVEKVPDGLRKGPWSVEETQKYLGYIESKGQMNASWKDIDWNETANDVGTRTWKQCRDKWRDTSFNPTFNKTPWTAEEQKILKEAYEIYGPQWTLIEQLQLLPGRSARQLYDRSHRSGLQDTQYENGCFTGEMLAKIQTLLHDLNGKYYDDNGKIRWTLLSRDHFPSWSPHNLKNGFRLAKMKANSSHGLWSKEETDKLRCAAENYLSNPTRTYGEQWAAIAEEVGTRSLAQCQKKWNSIQSKAATSKQSLHHTRWTLDQTLHLLSLAQQHSFKWSLVARDMASAMEEKSRRLTDSRLCWDKFWYLVKQSKKKMEPLLEQHLTKCLENPEIVEKVEREKRKAGNGPRKRKKLVWQDRVLIKEAKVEGKKEVKKSKALSPTPAERGKKERRKKAQGKTLTLWWE